MALPTDTSGESIQALRPYVTAGSHVIPVAGTSARNSTAFNKATRAIRVHTTVDIWFRLGSETVTAVANDHFLGAGKTEIFSLGSEDLTRATHFAALDLATDGTVYISELE